MELGQYAMKKLNENMGQGDTDTVSWRRILYVGAVAVGILNLTSSVALASPAFTMPTTTHQQNVEVAMRGEYASIDTKPIAAVMIRLQKTVGHENDALIVEIEDAPGNYAPPVFFALSRTLFKQGDLDNAMFWFNAGRLRGEFDAARCADPSARSAVSAMVSTMPVELRRAQFDDLTKLEDTIHKVVEWDRSTPYNYEYRWINLSGLNAISSGMGDAAADNKPLSLPKEQWPALAEKNRQDYLASLDAAIDQVTKARAKK